MAKKCREKGTIMDVIFSYTRAQAIDDGVLIDVSKMAKEAGFKIPVAMTSTLYGKHIEPDEKSKAQGQSVDGRLWDTLWMLSLAARTNKDESQIFFKVIYVWQGNPVVESRDTQTLKAICDGGDNGEPVLTIMLPNED